MLQVNKPHPRQEVIVTGSSRSLYAWRPRPSGGADSDHTLRACTVRTLRMHAEPDCSCSCLFISRCAAVTGDCMQRARQNSSAQLSDATIVAARQTRRQRSSRQRRQRPGERRLGHSALMVPESSCSLTPTTRPQPKRRSGKPPLRMMPARARARARRSDLWFSNIRYMCACRQQTHDGIWQITVHYRVACMLFLGAVGSPLDATDCV
jgi:hypothetical protein